MDRRAFRVFENIPKNMDYDMHIHTNWSQDNLTGPTFQDWLEIAERHNFHIGFTDHFEIPFYTYKPPKHADLGKWKLNPNTIDSYLEECDRLKNLSSRFSIGLEVSYHPDIQSHLEEFLDDYYSQFDYITGSVHDIDLFYAVTAQSDLRQLITRYGSFQSVVSLYFDRVQELIHSELFDVVAHPDVIYRFCTPPFFNTAEFESYKQKILQIAWSCQKTATLMEINLSGFRYSWQDSFPKNDLLAHLFASETPLIIGSDSHVISQFTNLILKLRNVNTRLRNEWLYRQKF